MSTQTIRAETPVYGGYVIGRDGNVIFIKGAIPGELVDVSVDEKKRDYWLASVTNIIEPSDFRRKPFCDIFGVCGGCHIQFIEYQKQVMMKEEILCDAMRRIAGINAELLPSVTGKEFGYRQRGQFKVSHKGELGFYRGGTREVIPVRHCPVMSDGINDLLRDLKGQDLMGVKELHITSGDSKTALIKGRAAEDLSERLFDAGVSGTAFENRESVGKDYVTLDLNGLKYSITPWSFFQSNWALNTKMVADVVSGLMPLDGKKVLDLYAGAGNFSLPVSVLAREVIAIEENTDAVEDGMRNTMLNNIRNCHFINMPVEEALLQGKGSRTSKLLNSEPFDVIILDPPRPGLTSGCIKALMSAGCGKIVYVSCNPATLARDIKKMSEKYDLEALRMIDFFPNTYHVEAVALLKQR